MPSPYFTSNQTIHRKHTEGQKNHFLGANRLLFRVEQENGLFTDLPVEQMARRKQEKVKKVTINVEGSI